MSELPSSIAVVVNDLEAWGSQRVALSVAQALREMVPATHLITLSGAADGDLAPTPPLERIALQRSTRGALGYGLMTWRLHRVLRTLRPELVISHMLLSNVTTLGALSVRRGRPAKRVLVTEHNLPSRNLSLERSAPALRRLASYLYPRATTVVGVSDAVVDDVCRTYGVPPARAVTVFNPVEPSHVADSRSPHPWLTQDSHLRTVVCVGAFREAKGQDVLVRALSHSPGVRAIFVGEGSLRDEVAALATSLAVADRVEFVGYRDDAPRFISRAAALVVPSRWEGFGLVAVEAAALGVPVIGTAVSGLSELIPTYVPGWLVPADDPAALSTALNRSTYTIAGRRPDLAPFEPRTAALNYLRAAGYVPSAKD